MGQVEGYSDARHTVWREPFVRQPAMGAKGKPAISQFSIELLDPFFDDCAGESQPQITHPHVEQFFVGEKVEISFPRLFLPLRHVEIVPLPLSMLMASNAMCLVQLLKRYSNF